MSRARRRRARRQGILGGVVLAVLSIGALAGGAWWWQRDTAGALDALGCRQDGDHDRLSILVDRSDALTPLQKRDVQGSVEAAVAAAETGTRVALHVLAPDDPLLAVTLFEGCRPPDGTAASAWTENERRLRTRWREDFEAPLRALLRTTLEDAPAARSPLLEALQSVALRDFASPAPDRRHRLLIVSDMLQHTDDYSHYRGDPINYARFAELGYARRVGARLDGVDVEIAYVGRARQDARQTHAHGLFWEAHVEANGGRLLSIRRVAGG